GNKADKADARRIADYAERERPPAWQPPSPEVRELQGLVRRIDDLTEAAAREKGRRASPALTAAVRRSVARTRRFLEREAARLRAAADALVVHSGPPGRPGPVGVDPGGRAADRHHHRGRAAGGGPAPDGAIGRRLLRAGPAGVRQRGQRSQ